jgi:L-threonylcarbamoyladenylate synthase
MSELPRRIDEDALDEAAAAVAAGDPVVYPTETVYGLGADALDADAVERVFALKRRDRDDPVSVAVPDAATAREYVAVDDRERAFMEAFLPGPVTVVCERRPAVPDVLTAGRDRVGVRIPDHRDALALLDRPGPRPATRANVSGRPSARRVADLDERIREGVAAVLDGGETPGGGSTVVDVSAGTIHRPGEAVDEVRAWLSDPPV